MIQAKNLSKNYDAFTFSSYFEDDAMVNENISDLIFNVALAETEGKSGIGIQIKDKYEEGTIFRHGIHFKEILQIFDVLVNWLNSAPNRESLSKVMPERKALPKFIQPISNFIRSIQALCSNVAGYLSQGYANSTVRLSVIT